MSITKDISTLINTGRGFELNQNLLQNISGIFLCKKGFTFTIDDLSSDEYFFNAFDNLDIVPLHLVQEIIPENEEVGYKKSIRDFTYKVNTGKYRHKLTFNWTNAYHKLVNEYSGSSLDVIYYDNARHIIATEESEGVYRGITTNRIELEKQDVFKNSSTIALSPLDIELRFSDEINKTGLIYKVDWLPQLIDKVFISLRVESIGSDFINFTAKHHSDNISDINSIDTSVFDLNNGDINFEFFNYNGGVYKLKNSNKPITTGCLTVNSNKWLGKVKYNYSVTIEIINNAIWGDGNNEIWGDGNNAVFTD